MVSFKIKKKLAPAARRLKRGDGLAVGDSDFKRLFRKKWKFGMKFGRYEKED